jgi:pilus assembly protein TadC
MNSDLKKTLASVVKVISTVLITAAIGLELWNIYNQIPSSLNLIVWLERFAITAHLIEAAIAAFYASTKNKIPIKYATYTFFVGTVGLLELFAKKEE